jgi:hypothetical protein
MVSANDSTVGWGVAESSQQLGNHSRNSEEWSRQNPDQSRMSNNPSPTQAFIDDAIKNRREIPHNKRTFAVLGIQGMDDATVTRMANTECNSQFIDSKNKPCRMGYYTSMSLSCFTGRPGLRPDIW